MFLILISLFLPYVAPECSFTSEFCHWQVQQPWAIVREALLPSPFDLPPQSLKSDGEFLLAQGYYGVNSTGTAVSPLLEGFKGGRLLSFSYTKIGGSAVLQIQLKEGLSYRTLDTIDIPSLQIWTTRTTHVPSTTQIHQIVFRISSVTDGLDTFAIDNVRLSPVQGKVISADSVSNINILAGNNFDDRDIRRSPSSGNNAASICRAIKCQFQSNSCFWNSSGFKTLEDKIVSENEEGILKSEPVLLPINAHLQISIFSSDSSLVSIYQKTGSDEVLLWSQGGVPLPGWNSFRIPIKYVALPSSFVIRSSSTSGNFLAISQTNLVDEKGRDLACGLNTPVIKPHHDDTVRLTALQQINDNIPMNPNVASIPFPPPHVFGTSRPVTIPAVQFPPLLSTTTAPNPIPILRFGDVSRSNFAAMPISPATVSSSSHDSIGFHSPVIRAASISQTEKIQNFQPVTDQPLVAQTSSSLNHLLSAAFGRQVSADEVTKLKQLAKNFGIHDLSSPRLSALLSAGKKLQGLPGFFPSGPVSTSAISSKDGAISPINKELQNLINSVPKEQLSLLSHLPPSINEAIASRINKILQNPSKSESRHFARNVDYALQRAFNDYVANSRP